MISTLIFTVVGILVIFKFLHWQFKVQFDNLFNHSIAAQKLQCVDFINVECKNCWFLFKKILGMSNILAMHIHLELGSGCNRLLSGENYGLNFF